MAKSYIRNSNYDSVNDILYVHFANDRGMSYASDSPAGFEIMRDLDTNEMTGFMVYCARSKESERQAQLHSLGYELDYNAMLR